MRLFESWDGQLEPEARAPRLAAEMAGVFRQKILAGALGADMAKEYRWPASAVLFDRLIQERPKE